MPPKRPKTPAEWTALAGLAALLPALSVRRLGDFDLPWHLANGRSIAATGTVPRVDDLAFTHRPIEYIEFLSDLAVYAVFEAGGAAALQCFFAGVVVTTAIVLYVPLRRHGAFALVGVASCLAAQNPWLLARPATLAFLLLAILLALLETHRRAPDSVGGRRAQYATVPLMVLWPNVHASAVLGVAVIVAYAAHRAAARWSRGRLGAVLPARDGDAAGFTALVAASASLASTLNTAGLGLYMGPLRARHDFGFIEEWRSPTWSFLFVDEPFTGGLLVLVVLALAFGRENGRRAPSAFDAVVVLFAIALSATSVRLIAFAAILVTPVTVRRLAGFVGERAVVGVACGASMVAASLLCFVRTYVSYGFGFEPTHFPSGAVAFVERAKPAGRMYNFMPFGGYLAWRLYPRHRVLVDGRSGFVHDPALSRLAHRSNFDDDAFRSLVDEYRLEWGVTRSREGESFGEPLSRLAGWTMVFFDDVGAVYVRKDGPNSRLAEQGYRVFDHLLPLGLLLDASSRGLRADELAHDGALAIAQAPTSPRAWFVEACGAVALGDRSRFDAASANLQRLAPGHPATRALREAWNRRNDVETPSKP